jgi:hypothetical protein
MLGCETGHVRNKLYPYSPSRPRCLVWAPQDIAINDYIVDCHLVNSLKYNTNAFPRSFRRVRYPAGFTFFSFSVLHHLLCTKSLWLIIALDLHRNSINGIHRINYFFLHLLFGPSGLGRCNLNPWDFHPYGTDQPKPLTDPCFSGMCREQTLVHSPPPHISEPLSLQGLSLFVFGSPYI